jgi:Caspase domain
MSVGYSIHIGINELSSHYSTESLFSLPACENDARVMASIAKKNGFNGRLFGKENICLSDEIALDANHWIANSTNIEKVFHEASSTLIEGDILLITYSGHGSSKKNYAEIDEYDETWCLWDRQFFDDEIFDLLTNFVAGVRVVIISDSCHSGTLIDWEVFGINKNLYERLRLQGVNFNNFESKILKEKRFNFAKFDENTWNDNLNILRLPEIEKQRQVNFEKYKEQLRNESLDKFIENETDSTIFQNIYKKIAELIRIPKFASGNSTIKPNVLTKLSNYINIKASIFFPQTNHLSNDKVISLNDISKIPLIENVKNIPRDLSDFIYENNPVIYSDVKKCVKQRLEQKLLDRSLAITPENIAKLLGVHLIVFSACQDNEETIAGCSDSENGMFTGTISCILGEENVPKLTYDSLHKKLEEILAEYKKYACDKTSLITKKQHPKIWKNSDSFLQQECLKI